MSLDLLLSLLLDFHSLRLHLLCVTESNRLHVRECAARAARQLLVIEKDAGALRQTNTEEAEVDRCQTIPRPVSMSLWYSYRTSG